MRDTRQAAVRSDEAVDPRAGKYLVFSLGSEEYGIPVRKVREIMRVQETTAVPQTPSHLRGVINLRGTVIPVIDLRARFGLSLEGDGPRSCIVVVQVDQAGRNTLAGLVVDAVSEVAAITTAEIENTPAFGDGVHVECLLGLAKAKGRVRILLDIDQVLSQRELAPPSLPAAEVPVKERP